jgi:hypothetical protein
VYTGFPGNVGAHCFQILGKLMFPDRSHSQALEADGPWPLLFRSLTPENATLQRYLTCHIYVPASGSQCVVANVVGVQLPN